MQSFVSVSYSEISDLLKVKDDSHFSRIIIILFKGMLGNNYETSNDSNTSSLSNLTSSFLTRSIEFFV